MFHTCLGDAGLTRSLIDHHGHEPEPTNVTQNALVQAPCLQYVARWEQEDTNTDLDQPLTKQYGQTSLDQDSRTLGASRTITSSKG